MKLTLPRAITIGKIYELLFTAKDISSKAGLSEFILNNYDKIKEIMGGKTDVESTVSTEVDWSKVPEGTVILVRDTEEMDWVERNFVYRKPCGLFSCYLKTKHSTVQSVLWKFAKLKP